MSPAKARIVVQCQIVTNGRKGLKACQLRIEYCLMLESIHRSTKLIINTRKYIYMHTINMHTNTGTQHNKVSLV